MRQPFIGVINMPNDTERLKRLTVELSNQGIDRYTIFPGIHDRLSVKKGINLAHKSVIEYAQLAGFEEVCVLEDDIKFTHPNSFQYFLESKPDNYDLYLGGYYVSKANADKTLYSFSGFHIYLCHSRFYEKFLSVEEDAHIDRAMEGLGKFVVSPKIVAEQFDGKSSNTGKEEVYGHLMAGKEIYKG
jgi:hypothetical protein